MLNNDVLRSLRYLLDVGDGTLEAFCQLADYPAEPGPVSYTHLDVYKRQSRHRGWRPSRAT